MPPALECRKYQRESGLTRATARAGRRFAALPVLFTFTVDVEDHGGGARAAPQTGRLLDLLEETGARGTFFVDDAVVRSDPALLRAIAARGHELASHGYRHQPLAEDRPETFRTGMNAARDRLADATGRAPEGFRAPYFSLTPQAAWASDVLAELGFAYSSSLLPAWNPLAGWPGAPRRPFLWPSGLLELPVPVARLGPLRLPFLGGMYLRWLPPWRLRQMAGRWAEEAAAGSALWSYCHPYDLDREERLVRRRDAGVLGSLMLWLNRGPTLPRLQGLLAGRRSVPFAEQLEALRRDAAIWRPGAMLRPAPAA